jgi:hypothetical protein
MKVTKPTPISSAMLVSSTATEAYSAWNSATAYALDTRVIRTTTNRIYQCIQGPSTNNTPETSPLYWTDVGPTNQWAMFDSEISTQTSAASTLTVVIKPGLCNSLALFGLEGTTLTVTVRDALAGAIVYSFTKSLDGTILADWYQYFFEPYVQLSEVVLTDLPPYGNAHITITITSGGTAKCGILVAGTVYYLGQSLSSPNAGIIDYSRKDTSALGITTFVKRSFSKRLSASLYLKNQQLNKVRSILADLRATPCVWISTETPGYEMLTLYGFYRDFSIAVEYADGSLCNLEIEGLT